MSIILTLVGFHGLVGKNGVLTLTLVKIRMTRNSITVASLANLTPH